MKSFRLEPVVSGLRGEISLLGDKSVAHRALILSAISTGKTIIRNFPSNDDCLSTLNVFKKLGIKVVTKKDSLIVFGKGLSGLSKPKGPIFVGESGTTLRLILGILAGQDFAVRLIAGKSLTKRPMLRVTLPLRMMGAEISAKPKAQGARLLDEYPPITIRGGNLKGIIYKMPVASAQVKSALLLAGLFAEGVTKVIEPVPTRDHTERMLKLFEADIVVKKKEISIKGNKKLISPGNIYVPGDISSASFFMVAGVIVSGSSIIIRNVSLNPSRMGLVNVLKRMKANITAKGQSPKAKDFEPLGDLVVKSSALKATVVKKEEIPSLIDELPILMVAACFAQGKTVFKGIKELRVKETDRVKSMTDNLKKMGARIRINKTAGSEDIIVYGVKRLKGCRVKSFGDHRTAMSVIVAGLNSEGKTVLDDVSCIKKSFPNFHHKILDLII